MPLDAMPCRAGLGEGKQAFGVMDIDVFLFFFYLHNSGAASRCWALCVPSISEDVSLGDEVEYNKL